MKKYLILIILLLTSCVARPIIIKPNDEAHNKQNLIIEKKVIQNAKTGDWLVTRGYHASDNLVSNFTSIPISHVGLFNAELQKVIEAEGKGVHFSELREFIDKSYRIIVIRPRWRTDKNANAAWENAKVLVGSGYDFLGTIGFNFPEKYYCSELAISVYKQWYSGKERFPTVIKPGELYLFGTILYDSLPRDEI